MKAIPPTASSTGLASTRSWFGLDRNLSFRRGLLRSLPISIGYFPIALAFGISAREAGMPGWVAMAMSATTYGGTAQMVALSMLTTGQSLLAIVLAVFVVNSRFFLLSTAITEKAAHWPVVRKLFFGTYLSDEAFAVLMSHGGHHKRRLRSMECIGIVAGPMMVWVAATAAGYWAADRLMGAKELGLDFALIALLLGVLACQIQDRFQLVVAIFAGMMSTAWTLAGHSTLAILLSALVAPLLGLAWEAAEKWVKAGLSDG